MYPRSRSTRSILVTLVLALAGCDLGADDEAEVADDPLASEAFAAVTPGSIALSCDVAGLVGTANECTGPWRYTRWRTCEARHPDCGPANVCTPGQEQTCRFYENGVEDAGTTTVDGGSKHTETCTETERKLANGEWDPAGTTCKFVSIPVCTAASGEALVENPIIAQINAEVWHNPSLKTLTIAGVKQRVIATPTVGSRTGPKSPWQVVGKTRTRTWSKYSLCSYKVKTVRAVSAPHSQCGCNSALVPPLCTMEHPACGSEQASTLPGDVRPAKQATITSASGGKQLLDVYTSQSCSTFDGPVDTVADVNNRAMSLALTLNGSPSFPNSPAGQISPEVYKQALAARLRLLLELRGHLLTADKRTGTRQLYAAGHGTQCNLPTNLAPECLAEVTAAGAGNRLQACVNLAARWPSAGTATPQDTALVQVDDCFMLFDDASTLSASCRGPVRDVAASSARSLFAAKLRTVGHDGTALTGLAGALSLLDTWYTRAAVAAPVTGTDADAQFAWRRQQTSLLLADIWERAHTLTRTLPANVNEASIDEALDRMSEAGLATDMDVLAAALDSSLDSPPLLALLSDALRALTDRLDLVSDAHDLACRYGECAALGTSMTAEVWRVLAALTDNTRLGEALAGALKLKASVSPAHVRVRSTLAKLGEATVQERLTSAFVADGNAGGLPALTGSGTLSPAAAGLAEIVLRGADRWQNFLTHGRFRGDSVRVLELGVQNRGRLITQLANTVAAFKAELTHYRTQRVALVNGLIGALEQQQEAQVGASRRDLLVDRLAEQSRDLDGLKLAEVSDRREWSLLEGFLESPGTLAELPSQSTPFALQVSARQARFDKSWKLEDVAVLAGGELFEIPLAAGDALRWQVTGTWSPSCAVSQHDFGDLGDLPGGHVQFAPLVGPEGYMLNASNGRFQADSTAETRTSTVNASAEVCIKAGFGSGPTQKAFGANWEIYAKACAGWSSSEANSTTDSSGTDRRMAASFTGGMRLAGTPFADAPAGALLLVIAHEGSRNVFDVQVAGQRGGYLAAADSRAYLVVNDKAGCLVPDNKLTFDAVRTRPLDALVPAIAEGLDGAIAALDAKRGEILAQGQVLPAQDTLLRQLARQRLQASTGLDLTQLPRPVQDFVNLWIDKEIVSLLRHAEISRLERNLQLGLRELEALDRELVLGGNLSRMHELLPRWHLRAMQTQAIAEQRGLLIRYLRDHVPAIFELRYPAALVALRSSSDVRSALVQLGQLKNLDFAAPRLAIEELLESFAGKVAAVLADAAYDERQYGVRPVVLRIPRPQVCDPVFGPCEVAPEPGAWRSVGLARATLLWDAIASRGHASLTITPDDLYKAGGGNGLLSCVEGAPVVRKFAFYVETEFDDAIVSFGPEVVAGRTPVFPLASGVPMYVIADEDEGPSNAAVPVLVGRAEQVLSKFAALQMEGAPFAGMSPFNTFDVNLQSFSSDVQGMDTASAILVVMELEYLPMARVGVPACLPQGSN